MAHASQAHHAFVCSFVSPLSHSKHCVSTRSRTCFPTPRKLRPFSSPTLPSSRIRSITPVSAVFTEPPSSPQTNSNPSLLPLRTAVLVSGGGRSLENICRRIAHGTLRNIHISTVITSKDTAGAIARAQKYNIPVHVIRFKDYPGSVHHFSNAITHILNQYAVDLVVLAGWMHFYHIPPRYLGKVINIHPSLIPAFCGKGFYGNRVHRAVLQFGAKITGCTVHLADNEYDHGPIILQKPVPVLDNDSPDDLAARVFEAEKEALPEALQLFADQRLRVDGRLVKIAQPSVPASEMSL